MMPAAPCRDARAAAPEPPPSLRAGFGAAIQGRAGWGSGLAPLDRRVASAVGIDKRGSDQRERSAWP